MRLASLFAVALAGAACSGPAQQQQPDRHAHNRPLSVDEHKAEADRHTRVAKAELAAAAADKQGTEIQCGTDPAEDQVRIGNERVRVAHPCFSSVTNPTADHLKEAADNKREAAKHRAQAAELVAAEARSCAGLDPSAMEHSPFYHHEDILSIDVLKQDKATVGVLVKFRPIKGLTRAWMEKVLLCHQARAAALGYPDDYMAPNCLSAIQGAEVDVTQRGEFISVAVRGGNGASASTILGRALSLQSKLGTKHEAHE